MIKLIIELGNQIEEYTLDEPMNLDEFLISRDYIIDRPCGGAGLCGKCKVHFKYGAPAPHAADKEILSDKELTDGWRLSCKATVSEDALVILEHKGKAKIIHKGLLHIDDISYDDPTLLNDQTYGVAVDLGTTTIVAYLVNLASGNILQAESVMNPQRAYGDNVISRCDYIAEDRDGLQTLHDIAIEAINDLIDHLCQENQVDPHQVRRFTLAGNTIMQHIILNVDPSAIAVAPFTPTFTETQTLSAEDMGLNIQPDALCHICPAVSGYIGGDTMAALKAVEMDTRDDISLLVDIGTNGEIVLGNKDRMLSCSAAAGPAFEGAHIQFGMGGVSGAINKVMHQQETVQYTTIDDVEAIGICGSGLLDAVALIKELNLLTETGTLDKDRTVDRDGIATYDLSDKVYITQKDIREVQLAKSAIAAGIHVLVNRMGITYDDIQHVYLAGGFGSYMDVHSAAVIGLLPKECVDQSQSVGNAAGMGAVKVLLSDRELQETQDVKAVIEYLELSFDMEFNNLFIDHMIF